MKQIERIQKLADNCETAMDGEGRLALLIDPGTFVHRMESGNFLLASTGWDRKENRATAGFVPRAVCEELGLEKDEYLMVTISVTRGRKKSA